MPSSSSSLPTPQQFLSSLLDAIAGISAPDANGGPENQEQATVSGVPRRGAGQSITTNPLRLLDSSHRNYLLTLHVLFPSLLLPALDLLDRGLVARLDLATTYNKRGDAEQEGGDGEGEDVGPKDEAHHHHRHHHHHLPTADQDTTQHNKYPTASSSTARRRRHVYHVRSATQKKYHPYNKRGTSTTSTTTHSDERGPWDSEANRHHKPKSSGFYIVHTTTWNCTCAAFAFAAVPAPLSLRETSKDMTVAADDLPLPKMMVDEGSGHGNDEVLSENPLFGGLSLSIENADEARRAIPPCCKHLLACVLAERWDAVLGRYVPQRILAREEMAGIFADI